jgi:hypothetical protein
MLVTRVEGCAHLERRKRLESLRGLAFPCRRGFECHAFMRCAAVGVIDLHDALGGYGNQAGHGPRHSRGAFGAPFVRPPGTRIRR